MQGCCLKATPRLFIIPCYYHSFLEVFMELLHGLEKCRFFSLSCIETGSGALINLVVALILHCSKSCVSKQKWKFSIVRQLCVSSSFLTFITHVSKNLSKHYKMGSEYWFFYCVEAAGEVINSTIISWSR